MEPPRTRLYDKIRFQQQDAHFDDSHGPRCRQWSRAMRPKLQKLLSCYGFLGWFQMVGIAHMKLDWSAHFPRPAAAVSWQHSLVVFLGTEQHNRKLELGCKPLEQLVTAMTDVSGQGASTGVGGSLTCSAESPVGGISPDYGPIKVWTPESDILKSGVCT